MIKKLILLVLCVALSFDAFAGWKTKAFFAGGAFAVHAALKSPAVRKKIIEKTVANPKLKEKAKSILTAFIKDPKKRRHVDKAKDFAAVDKLAGLPRGYRQKNKLT